MAELQTTINATPCDLVLIATPIDLARLLDLHHPSQRVYYDLAEVSQPDLNQLLRAWLKR